MQLCHESVLLVSFSFNSCQFLLKPLNLPRNLYHTPLSQAGANSKHPRRTQMINTTLNSAAAHTCYMMLAVCRAVLFTYVLCAVLPCCCAVCRAGGHIRDVCRAAVLLCAVLCCSHTCCVPCCCVLLCGPRHLCEQRLSPHRLYLQLSFQLSVLQRNFVSLCLCFLRNTANQ